MSTSMSKKERIEAAKRRERKLTLAIGGGVLVLIVVGAGLFVAPSIKKTLQPESSPTFASHAQAISICTEGYPGLAEHIHPELTIMIEGKQVIIPEGIGLSYNCTKPVHTHDTTGIIHIESPYLFPFDLCDFFTIWGQTFNSGQILGCKADPTHRITMAINTIPNNEYEKYVMNDGDRILIRCTRLN